MAEFECPVCRSVSHHPEDVRQGYCGRCHAFTGACALALAGLPWPCAGPPAVVLGNLAACAGHVLDIWPGPLFTAAVGRP